MLGEGGVGQGAPKGGYGGIHRSPRVDEQLRDLFIVGPNGNAQRFGLAAVFAVDAICRDELTDFFDAPSLGGAIQRIGLGTKFGTSRWRAVLSIAGLRIAGRVEAWREFKVANAVDNQLRRCRVHVAVAECAIGAVRDAGDVIVGAHSKRSHKSDRLDGIGHTFKIFAFADCRPPCLVKFRRLFRVICGNAKVDQDGPAISVGDEYSLAVAADPPSFHGADELSPDCDTLSLPLGQILKKGADRDYFQRSDV